MDEKSQTLEEIKEFLGILVPVILGGLLGAWMFSGYLGMSFWNYFLNYYGFLMILFHLGYSIILIRKYFK